MQKVIPLIVCILIVLVLRLGAMHFFQYEGFPLTFWFGVPVLWIGYEGIVHLIKGKQQE
jgi:hypothetical protein